MHLSLSTYAVGNDTIRVAVRANVAQDKIQLRWAVNSPSAWYFTNSNGFSLVRYTILRDTTVLDVPERKILAEVLKPKPLDDWEHIAQRDNYAAIIAQALYGESFEVSGGEEGISHIIALSQEQQQRYAMSLLAAERSFPAAVFAGWGFVDYTVKPGERYLYQIIPLNVPPHRHVEIGVAFVGLSDYSELPRPLDFTAIWGNGSVLLTWDYRNMLSFFSAYYLERSRDNRNFERVNDMPLTNIMGSDRMFFTDNITNGVTYYYRLQGVNTFGVLSPFSDTISGQGVSRLMHVPFIRHAIPDEQGGVDIEWSFDERGESYIKGFELRQSATIGGDYTAAVSGISPEKRIVNHPNPLSEGYLMIAAIPFEGEPTLSFPHLFQMEDTIPPAIPTGLQGYVDTLGVVHLTWELNTEPDFLGYRIYRGQTEGEELIPLNDIAHTSNVFTDTINIHNLNPRVFYAVASLDRRYNQSDLSEILVLEKPDVVKPSPPFITRFEVTENGVRLEWASGQDETIRSFRIFRRERGENESQLVAEIADINARSHTDETVVGDTDYIYYIKSATRGGLESDASPEIAVRTREVGESNAGITQFRANRTTNGIRLTWQHSVMNVRSVSIYRRAGEEPFTLWREMDSGLREITDTNALRSIAYEYMLVIRNQQGRVFTENVQVR